MLDIISRDAWYAKPSNRDDPLPAPVRHVFVINTHTKPCRRRVYCNGMIRRIQQFNINIQRKPDIRYNFLIGGDGFVYEGRGWAGAPELPKFYKLEYKSCVLIAYLGTYTVNDVPKNMAEAAIELVRLGIKDGWIAMDFEYHDITRNIQPDTDKRDIM